MTYTLSAFRRAAFRFFVYGSLLVAGEVAFYTLVKLGRLMPAPIDGLFQFIWLVDPALELGRVWTVPIKSLYGQASLWMFFVYGAIALFGLETAYHRVRRWPWLLRGLLYAVVILAMECATGWVLLWGTGLKIWYYADRWSIFTFTSLAIAPLWFALGLLAENFHHIIDKLTRVKGELEQVRTGGGSTA
jgi:hypothetical protein